jgi:undecaprenyl-diphosphatase
MVIWQALLLGLIQGVAELFPVSSLGQTILIVNLFKWETGNDFLAFLVALHLATAVALLIYFWADWGVVFRAYAGSLRQRKLVYDGPSKFAWLLVAGTIVVGAVGVLFEKHLRTFFENPRYAWIVAAILVLNGLLMLFADMVKKRTATPTPEQGKRTEDMTLPEGAAVGAAQTLALFPGVSRSGAAIVGGLLAGLTYEEASRFAFMLATPVIGLAAIRELPTLLGHEARPILVPAIAGAVVAGIAAYLSVSFLMKYFRHHRLAPFAYYCIAFGLVSLILLYPH